MIDNIRETTPTDTLQELRVFVWGSQSERDDQRARWNGLSDSEISATLEAEIAEHVQQRAEGGLNG